MQPLNKLNLSIRFQNWWKNNQSNKHQGLVLIRYQGVVAEIQRWGHGIMVNTIDMKIIVSHSNFP